MEKPNSSTTSLVRTKSDQLLEIATAALKSPPNATDGDGIKSEGGGTLSRKSSRRLMIPASPGRGGGNSKNTHIRKSRSAQLNKLELDEVSSGAALSRASSASLGLSFSFTGFTMPPDEIADSKPFSDDDTRKYSSILLQCGR